MRFDTCSCHKESPFMRCIYTGIYFLNEDTVRCGDMFFCDKCKALSIHGIPSGAVWADGERPYVAVYEGFFLNEKGYECTEDGGIIVLLPKAIEYLATHDSMVFIYQRS